LQEEQKENLPMTRRAAETGIRQRRIGWGVLFSLMGYLLNLCTLSPLVHADTLRQSGPGQSAIPDHCKRPPSTASPSPPLTADQGTTPEPLCCEFRSGQNKALSSSFAHSDFRPLLAPFLLPFATTSIVAGALLLYEIHALHSSRPPPLYLLHAVFLI